MSSRPPRFALLVVAHAVRLVLEGTRLLTEPDFVLATLIPAGLDVWGWRLLHVKEPVGSHLD